MYTIVQPQRILMGFGALSALEEVMADLDPRRILVVTGPNVRRLGILDRALACMGPYRKTVELFVNPKPDPDVAVVEECAREVMERNCDLIVGLGGGSPMDVAKGAAVVATHGGEMRPLLGRDTLRRNGIPAILIPTTSGSGTEVTQAAVVHVPEEGTKKSIWDPRTTPYAAIVDPELAISMPPRLTAETGLDALVHAIEGHTSTGATPMSRLYTLEAIRLIGAHLPRAYRDGDDREAREAMARAATLAGIGMSNAGLGAIHALALALDPRGLTHCQSVAVMAPWVVGFNARGNEKLFAVVAQALTGDTGRVLHEELVRLLESVGISPFLRDYGIIQWELDSLAVKAHRVGQRLLPTNIREVTQEDVKAIFAKAYGT
ncbi:MAG: iron-containing alcohol dehydrogenase family protein [Thermodesulfobacteriota bacterium]